jgi:hypothetical protein
MTDTLPPDLLQSPAFLLVALIAGRATHDVSLERLAARRLADLGIKVAFASDTRGKTRRSGAKEATRA